MILPCLKCLHGKLSYDEHRTFEKYYKVVQTLINKKGEILEETIPLYLVYSCEKCGEDFTLTYKEVEAMVRKRVAYDVTRMRILRYIRENQEPADITESNTMILCGECEGFDGKGNCPDRFFNRCELRTKAHGIQLP